MFAVLPTSASAALPPGRRGSARTRWRAPGRLAAGTCRGPNRPTRHPGRPVRRSRRRWGRPLAKMTLLPTVVPTRNRRFVDNATSTKHSGHLGPSEGAANPPKSCPHTILERFQRRTFEAESGCFERRSGVLLEAGVNTPVKDEAPEMCAVGIWCTMVRAGVPWTMAKKWQECEKARK